MKNNDININLNQQGGEPKVSLITKTFNGIADSISNASWKRIFKVYLVVFFFLATGLIALFAYNIVKNEETIHQVILNISNSNKEENIRDFVVTPKIQHDLKLLTYTLNADRAFLFELHNGKKNTSGLPFRFADMTYEEVNEDRKVDKVAMEFQNIPLTLYKYPHYLQKQKMILGTIDEIEKIDVDFANHIKKCGGKYLGMIYINVDGLPLGFLCVSYHNLNDVPDPNLIAKKLTEHDKALTQLLDLEALIKDE